MRVATARVASRRGSSMTILRPASHGNVKEAEGNARALAGTWRRFEHGIAMTFKRCQQARNSLATGSAASSCCNRSEVIGSAWKNSLSLFRWERCGPNANLPLMQASAHFPRNAPRFSRGRRLVRRHLLHGGQDDGHLLPSVLRCAQAKARKRRVLPDAASRDVLGLSRLQALPAARHRRQAAGLGCEARYAGSRRHRPSALRPRSCVAWVSSPRGPAVIFSSTMA